MSRLLSEDAVIHSLMEFTKGKKTLGQCIEDTPTAYDVSNVVGGLNDPVKSKVISILEKANGEGKGTSKLNKYIQAIKNQSTGKNYRQLSFSQMAELASILGIEGVTAENIKGDTTTKNRIKDALMLSGFLCS